MVCTRPPREHFASAACVAHTVGGFNAHGVVQYTTGEVPASHKSIWRLCFDARGVQLLHSHRLRAVMIESDVHVREKVLPRTEAIVELGPVNTSVDWELASAVF